MGPEFVSGVVAGNVQIGPYGVKKTEFCSLEMFLGTSDELSETFFHIQPLYIHHTAESELSNIFAI